MSATITGYLRAVFAASPHANVRALADNLTRDENPAQAPGGTYPRALVKEEIASTRDAATGRTVLRMRDMHQLEVQQQREPGVAEDYTLRDNVIDTLEAALPGRLDQAIAPRVFRLRVGGTVRQYDARTKVVRHILTLTVVRG